MYVRACVRVCVNEKTGQLVSYSRDAHFFKIVLGQREEDSQVDILLL